MSEPAIQKPRTYPRWVGVILCILMPGSAHFFSGQKLLGVGLWLGVSAITLGLCVSLVVPGHFGQVAAWLFVATLVVYFVVLLILSYRPVYRLGCFGWPFFLLLILLLNSVFSILVKTWCVEAFAVQGMSMAPTFIAPSEFAPRVQRADRIVVNKWIYRTCEPQRGDLVVFQTDKINKNKEGLPTVFVKRLVGLPGETVDIDPPYVLINGERLTEPAIFDTISSKQGGYSGYFQPETLGGPALLPITLGPDEYFLLGDNSPRSYDSRYWGPVLREKIRGKAIRIYWPPSRIRDLE